MRHDRERKADAAARADVAARADAAATAETVATKFRNEFVWPYASETVCLCGCVCATAPPLGCRCAAL